MPIYRMTIKTRFPGGSGAGTNTWHFRSTDAPVFGAPSPADIVKTFYTTLAGQFGATYFWSWDGSLQEILSDQPALVAVQSGFTLQGSGGGNADSGPAGVGMCITWRTSVATKSGRGRTFIAPLPVAYYESNGTIVDANLTTIRAAAAQVVSSSQADGNGAICVYSPKDAVARDVIGSTINDEVAYLSSRRT